MKDPSLSFNGSGRAGSDEVALASSAVPYEKQLDIPGQRMCGAAALCMVYRSFQLTCSQSEVWSAIARPGAGGQHCARTHLLARAALERGLAALVVQPRDPWRALQSCAAHGIRVILNHRQTEHPAAGHYSVLVAVAEDHLRLHDPRLGPDQYLPRAEFLRLWAPIRGRSEITGHVFVAVAESPGPWQCPRCQASLFGSQRCTGCGQVFPLQPSAALGCADSACSERLWSRLFCPYCDRVVYDLPGASSG